MNSLCSQCLNVHASIYFACCDPLSRLCWLLGSFHLSQQRQVTVHYLRLSLRLHRASSSIHKGDSCQNLCFKVQVHIHSEQLILHSQLFQPSRGCRAPKIRFLIVGKEWQGLQVWFKLVLDGLTVGCCAYNVSYWAAISLHRSSIDLLS